MLHLIKILNGRVGVPEPERLSLTAAVSVKYGNLITVKDGAATLFTASATALPTHLVLADSESKTPLCAPISPDMRFEVKLAAAPDAMTVGSEYLLTSDGEEKKYNVDGNHDIVI